jgi:glycosyltransferase involved in cell wall biosynthesis
MTIVFVLASLGSGGAERVVSLLANKMVERGNQVEIICLKFNYVYYQTDSRVKVTLAMQQTKNRLTEVFWLRKYLKQQKPDVVIPFTEGVYCFTILSLLGTGIPIIASERLDPAAMSKTRKILKRILLPFADWLVVQTQSIKDYFPESIQKKTSIIYNPVNDSVFNLPSLQGRAGERLNRIISVGRLYPQKNQEMMIRAFAKVADEFPDWQLVIFGEGPLRESLELIVDSLELQDRVLLPGRTEQVVEELRKSKIFCMSSDYEGMSNAMIEAICVGLPIISTKVSGTDELIKDSENGLLVEIGDESSLEDCMSKLMSSAVERENMSDRDRKIAGLFDIDYIVNQWMELIDKVKNEPKN